MPRSDKANEVHRRLMAERCDSMLAHDALAQRRAAMVAQMDAGLVRTIVARDGRRLAAASGDA